MARTATPITPALGHETAGQERRFAAALAVLQRAVEQRTFPGAACAVVQRGKIVLLAGVGRLRYEAEAPPVRLDTIFDLASVSKVLATTTAAAIGYERGWLDLEQPLAEVAPELLQVDDRRRRRVTLRMLLAHRAGLPAYVRLFERFPAQEWAVKPRAERAATMLQLAASVPLEAEPGMRALYSDIGFLLLGVVLERLAGEALDVFCAGNVFQPLGMTRAGFRPLPADSGRECIAPTVDDCDFRGRVIQGEVHDENAWAMGGVAGHAGVFATALEVAQFAHALLAGGAPLLQRETLARFTRRAAAPAGTRRALGWDTPSRPSQSGRYFGEHAYGHLGYTGTSLWIDPERALGVVLLSNRTWPDHAGDAIKQVRPAFHDAVVEALE